MVLLAFLAPIPAQEIENATEKLIFSWNEARKGLGRRMLMMEPEAEGHAGPRGEEYWREQCAALQAEVAEWRSKAEERREEMEEVEASFAEFMESSKALEQEMERDLQRSEKKNDETSRALSLLKLQHEDLLVRRPLALSSAGKKRGDTHAPHNMAGSSLERLLLLVVVVGGRPSMPV